jgi:hypothetical protein
VKREKLAFVEEFVRRGSGFVYLKRTKMRHLELELSRVVVAQSFTYEVCERSYFHINVIFFYTVASL